MPAEQDPYYDQAPPDWNINQPPPGNPGPGGGGNNGGPGGCPPGTTFLQNGRQGPGCYAQECPPGGIPGSPTCPPPAPETPAPDDGGRGEGCPPGQSRGGHPGNPCRPRPNYNPGGNGGGGGGGGARPVVPLPTPVTPGPDPNERIREEIEKMLRGEYDPYDDATIERMKGSLHDSITAKRTAEQQSLDEELASSGLGYSGIRAKSNENLRTAGVQAYGQGVRNILLERQKGQLELKLKAIDNYQRWLDSLRGYWIDKDRNSIQLKQIDLGYARLRHEREMLERQLAARGGGGGGTDPLEEFLRLVG